MQKCKDCGAEIKYIATGNLQSVKCNAEKLIFVTDFGRKMTGYLIHDCKKFGGENGERANKTRD